jgi:flagellar basal-body rod modification protein FlgD
MPPTPPPPRFRQRQHQHQRQVRGHRTRPAAKTDFLKLLVAQLSNQDPMNPMDNAQMTSQIAQINTVTGIQQVNQLQGRSSVAYSAIKAIL